MRWIALSLAAFTVACGGGGEDGADAALDTTDISGWYQTGSEQSGPCGSLEASMAPPAFVWVEPFDTVFYVRYCSAAAEGDCYATPYYDFTDPITDGWAAEGGSAFYSAGCTLSWERSTATLAGDALRVHTLRYTVQNDLAQADCTLAAAQALTEPCTYETELTATRLAR